MYCRPSQSLCPSWQNLEQTFSVEAPTAQASSFSMDRYTVVTSHQTLCPTLLLGIFGTKHSPEKRFQGKSHRIAPRQTSNNNQGYGLPCKLARGTIVERIATETKHIMLHYSACPLRTTARGRRLLLDEIPIFMSNSSISVCRNCSAGSCIGQGRDCLSAQKRQENSDLANSW